MTKSLPEKLDRALLYDGGGETSELPEEAATRIRQLEAENAALREALEPFAALWDEIIEACIETGSTPAAWAKACEANDLRRARALLADRASEGRR